MINKKGIAIGEMFLMISFSFAATFILGEVVSGQIGELTNRQKAAAYLGERGLEDKVVSETLSPATNTPSGITNAVPPPIPPPNVPAGWTPNVNAVSGKWAGGDLFVAPGKGLENADGTQFFYNGNYYDKAGNTLNGPIGATKIAGEVAGSSGAFGNTFKVFGKELISSAAPSHLINGLVWGGMVFGLFKILGATGILEEGLADSLAISSFVGVSTWQGAHAVSSIISGTGQSVLPLGVAPLIGLGLGLAVFLITYKREKQELVRFECMAWESQLGGSKCDECNNKELPCSEYRCKSLGQACELVNKGSEEEMCVWVHKDDTSAPFITPLDEALMPEGLTYVPDSTISPPNTGFRILSRPDGCLQPFTRLEYGFTTNEPAQCKVSLVPVGLYDEMGPLFVGETNLFLTEHIQTLKVPSPFTEEGEVNVVPEIHNDGTYTLWTRCIDANGNGKDGAMVAFRYCVKPGPDVTPPVIVGTSIESGKPVTSGVDSIPGLEVYTNEPSECRWSKQDKAFDVMENEMECASETREINADLNYVCSGTLTGIKDRENNDFYFRCKDYSKAPGGRNEMPLSYRLVLRGSEALIINKVEPKGDILGSTGTVEVLIKAETSHGSDEGLSICYIGEEQDNLIEIDDDFVYAHNQSLFLTEGDYTYYFRCIDAGGNTAENVTNFRVVVDKVGPSIARVYREGSGLKVITSEAADCSYSLTTCNYNFEDGTRLLPEDVSKKVVHLTEWDSSKAYHIKCRDLQGNQPVPNACNLVVQGSEL